MTLTQYINSQFSVIQELDFFARIILACICGACIGFERSRRFKEAGIRTPIIGCCAAALLVIVSKYGFADLTGSLGDVFNGTRGADPARVAAQVVSGVSFLGAGVIFKNGNTIKGLTTAAGLWATAGIGLAIGSGLFVLGIFTTAVIAVLQIIMHRYTVGVDAMALSRWRFNVSGHVNFIRQLEDYAAKHRLQIVESTVTQEDNGTTRYEIVLRSPHDMDLGDLEFFIQSHEVSSITCVPVG